MTDQDHVDAIQTAVLNLNTAIEVACPNEVVRFQS